ncbi:hypothetical protein NKH77_09455 [Streptomyces sp. M19]
MSLVAKVEIIQFNEDEPDYVRDFSSEDRAGSWYYTPGGVGSRGHLMVRVHTDDGLTGEYAYHASASACAVQAVDVARVLVGRPWQQRERLLRTARRLARPMHNYGLSFVDNALWDLAGKAYGASLTELLGGWRDRVPAYASTVNGDRAGSLSSTDQVVEFFGELQRAGWTGFKMHSWHEGDKWEEARNVARMREVLGERAELMLDPRASSTRSATPSSSGRRARRPGSAGTRTRCAPSVSAPTSTGSCGTPWTSPPPDRARARPGGQGRLPAGGRHRPAPGGRALRPGRHRLSHHHQVRAVARRQRRGPRPEPDPPPPRRLDAEHLALRGRQRVAAPLQPVAAHLHLRLHRRLDQHRRGRHPPGPLRPRVGVSYDHDLVNKLAVNTWTVTTDGVS